MCPETLINLDWNENWYHATWVHDPAEENGHRFLAYRRVDSAVIGLLSQMTFCHVTIGRAQVETMKWLTVGFHLAASVSGCWYCACWLTVTAYWGTRIEWHHWWWKILILDQVHYKWLNIGWTQAQYPLLQVHKYTCSINTPKVIMHTLVILCSGHILHCAATSKCAVLAVM